MTKKQKIWFAIFLAMFLVPEVLWSPVSNFYYEFWQAGDVHPLRNNFLMDSDNLEIFKLITLMQFCSLLASLFVLVASKFSNKLTKFLSILSLTILLLFVGFVVLFAFYNNPQIG